MNDKKKLNTKVTITMTIILPCFNFSSLTSATRIHVFPNTFGLYQIEPIIKGIIAAIKTASIFGIITFWFWFR